MRLLGRSDTTPSPVGQLLADPNFRRFWLAQLLYFGANGTVRFTFIWLVVTLTDWPSAEGLVALALGLPAMVLSVPAGAWSDRVDRKKLFVWGAGASFVFLTIFTAVIAAGRANTFLAAVAALLIGAALTINLPNLQAIVPLLVPPERLMNAAALQNGGGQAASFVGLALGGLAIQLLGDAGGFGLIAVATAGAVLLMMRVEIPEPVPADGMDTENRDSPDSVWTAVVAGAKFGLGSDPLRTLLILTVMLGGSFSVMQVSMPRVVEETYNRGSIAAGVVLGSFGIGMMASSAMVSNRASLPHGLNVARFIGIGLGLGQFLLSLATTFWVAVAVMVGWGVNAGVAMASHRTLMQSHTPPEMMGRIMGLMMLGFAGALPIGAVVSSVLAPSLGPIVTMRAVGLVTMAVTIPLTWRRSILTLR